MRQHFDAEHEVVYCIQSDALFALQLSGKPAILSEVNLSDQVREKFDSEFESSLDQCTISNLIFLESDLSRIGEHSYLLTYYNVEAKSAQRTKYFLALVSIRFSNTNMQSPRVSVIFFEQKSETLAETDDAILVKEWCGDELIHILAFESKNSGHLFGIRVEVTKYL
jgi:hypothetical protein